MGFLRWDMSVSHDGNSSSVESCCDFSTTFKWLYPSGGGAGRCVVIF